MDDASDDCLSAMIASPEDVYYDLVDAVALHVEHALGAKAIAILKDLNRGSFLEISDFQHELEWWPFISKPQDETTASVTFWAFQNRDRCEGLYSHIQSFLTALVADAIEGWPPPEQRLVLEACSLDVNLRPSESCETEKRSAANKALLKQLHFLLSDYDIDVLSD